MSGFEADWLTLREPADRLARDRQLLAAAAAHVSARRGAVIDLGCGTGSTFRALDPLLEAENRWVFVDDDQTLLDRARELQPPAARKRILLHPADLASLDDALFADAALVTASALFDLVSARFIEEFAGRMRARSLAVYAALTVDGRVVWERPHPLDDEIAKAFSEDQRRDKGFGPGLGGDAALALESAFHAIGYEVRSASSDWHLASGNLVLQDVFHAGFAAPARSMLNDEDIAGWLHHRAEAARAGARVRIGHRDMLALPHA